jgi:cell division protein FtsW (lipid II flippase)
MTISLFACIVWAGKTLPTVGGRVQSYLDPFGAVIDDMARLLWFQKEVPLLGFGFGNVPWRGYSFKDSSVGLPLQLQSDYTFTGLMGEFGVGAWVLVGLVAFWGLELARAHARKAPVDTCSLMAGGGALRDGFRSWLALVFGCLLTVQTALTVSGNLALVPLTGITLPWMSFGNTALWIMTLFFALLVDVNMEESRQ